MRGDAYAERAQHGDGACVLLLIAALSPFFVCARFSCRRAQSFFFDTSV